MRETKPGEATAALIPLLSDYLDGVAGRTMARLGEVAGVAMTFGDGEEPWTIGASNSLAEEVDLIQYDVGTGPCLHALRTGEGLYIPDLAADDRWSEYGPRAADRGAASCVSVPIELDGSTAAVLKVYAARVDGLSQAQRDLATTVAIEVAGGIGLARHLSDQAHELDDRDTAMNTRRTIDLALGILMERTRCDADAAFAMLRDRSQHSNVKLHAVAREVVATVPGTPPPVGTAPFNKRGSAPRGTDVKPVRH